MDVIPDDIGVLEYVWGCSPYISLTIVVRVGITKEPVKDVVVSLQTRLLIGHTRFLEQVCEFQNFKEKI